MISFRGGLDVAGKLPWVFALSYRSEVQPGEMQCQVFLILHDAILGGST